MGDAHSGNTVRYGGCTLGGCCTLQGMHARGIQYATGCTLGGYCTRREMHARGYCTLRGMHARGILYATGMLCGTEMMHARGLLSGSLRRETDRDELEHPPMQVDSPHAPLDLLISARPLGGKGPTRSLTIDLTRVIPAPVHVRTRKHRDRRLCSGPLHGRGARGGTSHNLSSSEGQRASVVSRLLAFSSADSAMYSSDRPRRWLDHAEPPPTSRLVTRSCRRGTGAWGASRRPLSE